MGYWSSSLSEPAGVASSLSEMGRPESEEEEGIAGELLQLLVSEVLVGIAAVRVVERRPTEELSGLKENRASPKEFQTTYSPDSTWRAIATDFLIDGLGFTATC